MTHSVIVQVLVVSVFCHVFSATTGQLAWNLGSQQIGRSYITQQVGTSDVRKSLRKKKNRKKRKKRSGPLDLTVWLYHALDSPPQNVNSDTMLSEHFSFRAQFHYSVSLLWCLEFTVLVFEVIYIKYMSDRLSLMAWSQIRAHKILAYLLRLRVEKQTLWNKHTYFLK